MAKDHSFHPIRAYLGSLAWDGVERIANFASRYLGAEDTPYHRAVSRCLFIAAVARIMRPGCKADYVPIFEGAQDKGKSTAIELLFTPWFSDDLAELGTKDAAMQVRVAWGIEIAELASMTRGEIERVKAFITRKVDRFRPSYGRRVIEVPRQSIFIGSTNSDAYLKDETGGRRFWPIRCGANIDLKAIERDRDQLWAEAVAQFNAGAPWWIADNDIIGLARDEQAARYVDDPWQEPIANFLRSQTDVSIGEVLSNLLIERGRWTQADQNRVARCLKVLGWERFRGPRPLREWRYRRVVPVESGTEHDDWDQQPIDIIRMVPVVPHVPVCMYAHVREGDMHIAERVKKKTGTKWDRDQLGCARGGETSRRERGRRVCSRADSPAKKNASAAFSGRFLGLVKRIALVRGVVVENLVWDDKQLRLHSIRGRVLAAIEPDRNGRACGASACPTDNSPKW